MAELGLEPVLLYPLGLPFKKIILVITIIVPGTIPSTFLI